jgi:hypothetical protein
LSGPTETRAGGVIEPVVRPGILEPGVIEQLTAEMIDLRRRIAALDAQALSLERQAASLAAQAAAVRAELAEAQDRLAALMVRPGPDAGPAPDAAAWSKP